MDESFSLPNQEAVTIATARVETWISRFGVPLELHSDEGRNFESKVFGDFAKLLRLRKTRITILNPRSVGMVERFNYTINQFLCKIVHIDQRNWDNLLPLFLLAYRSSVRESTKETPELRLPCNSGFGTPP